jgi:hypothetical protein
MEHLVEGLREGLVLSEDVPSRSVRSLRKWEEMCCGGEDGTEDRQICPCDH